MYGCTEERGKKPNLSPTQSIASLSLVKPRLESTKIGIHRPTCTRTGKRSSGDEEADGNNKIKTNKTLKPLDTILPALSASNHMFRPLGGRAPLTAQQPTRPENSSSLRLCDCVWYTQFGLFSLFVCSYKIKYKTTPPKASCFAFINFAPGRSFSAPLELSSAHKAAGTLCVCVRTM